MRHSGTGRWRGQPAGFPLGASGGGPAARHILLAVPAVILVAWLAGCSGRNLPAEKDPHYLRGMRLEQEGKHEDAVAAFQRCLRRNPECAKAHLQLGILYEDTVGDTVAAMYHYDRYLQQVAAGDDAEMVRRWRQRTEKAYYERLREALAPAAEVEPTPAASPPPASDQDRQLVESVRQLQVEVQQLRQQLAPSASTAASPASPAVASPPAVATVKPVSPAPEPTAAPGGQRYYTVNAGDSLSEVSRRVYGTSRHWATLRDANRDVLKGSDRLKPGMQLRIPDLRSDAEPKG